MIDVVGMGDVGDWGERSGGRWETGGGWERGEKSDDGRRRVGVRGDGSGRTRSWWWYNGGCGEGRRS